MEIAIPLPFNITVFIDLPYRSLGMLLSLIILTIASYILMVKIRRERVIRFGNYRTLKRIHGYRMLIPHPLILISKIITVVLLFLIATQAIKINIVRPVANTDFVLLIDSSQSMMMPDYKPNRLEFAKDIAIKWLNKLPGTTKIGVIKFSDKPSIVVDLTTNPQEIEEGIRSIEISLNSSGTAIGDAIKLGASILEKSPKQRFIILITDGSNNVGSSLMNASSYAKSRNVSVYVIGIESTEETQRLFQELQEIAKRYGIEDFSLPELDREGLQEVATFTGGKFFVATNESLFEKSFEKIIVKNERIPVSSDFYILMFVSILIILELIAYAKIGAL